MFIPKYCTENSHYCNIAYLKSKREYPPRSLLILWLNIIVKWLIFCEISLKPGKRENLSATVCIMQLAKATLLPSSWIYCLALVQDAHPLALFWNCPWKAAQSKNPNYRSSGSGNIRKWQDGFQNKRHNRPVLWFGEILKISNLWITERKTNFLPSHFIKLQSLPTYIKMNFKKLSNLFPYFKHIH